MNTAALWYLSRGTGVVSFVLLTITVVLGLFSRGGVRLGELPRFVTPALHRSVALLSVVFLGVHVTTAVADPYAPIRIVDAVVPFVSAYHPFWLGFGALGLDLVGALVLTSLLRRHIGARVWRAVHWLAYAAWPVALIHAVGIGPDASRPWMLLTVLGSLIAVMCTGLWRLIDVPQARRKPRPARRHRLARAGAVVALVTALVGLAGWAVHQPLASTQSGATTAAATSSTATTPSPAQQVRSDDEAGDD